MSWVMTSGVRGALVSVAVAGAGVAVMGGTVPANVIPGTPMSSFAAQDDPGCDAFGWQHPLCAGGAFESSSDDGIPGDNAAEGGIPAPAMVPNVDGSLSPPGTPGAI